MAWKSSGAEQSACPARVSRQARLASQRKSRALMRMTSVSLIALAEALRLCEPPSTDRTHRRYRGCGARCGRGCGRHRTRRCGRCHSGRSRTRRNRRCSGRRHWGYRSWRYRRHYWRRRFRCRWRRCRSGRLFRDGSRGPRDGLGLRRQRRFRRRRRWRWRRLFHPTQLAAHLLRDVDINGTRVRFLFSHTETGQQLENYFGLDLEFASQVIDADLRRLRHPGLFFLFCRLGAFLRCFGAVGRLHCCFFVARFGCLFHSRDRRGYLSR